MMERLKKELHTNAHFFLYDVLEVILQYVPFDIFTARFGASTQNLERNQEMYLEPEENM